MNLIEGIFLLINVVAILDIFLILKILYSLDMEISWKTLFIVSVIYYITDFIIIYGELQAVVPNYISTCYTIGFLLFVTLLFSKKHRILNLLLVFPAILTYMQWVQVIAMIEKLIGLDRYYFYIQKDKITPLYCFQDISLLLLLIYLERKGVKEQYRMRLTFGEGLCITIFCLFFPLFTSVLDRVDKNLSDPYFSVCWVVFVLAVNVAVVYAIAHRKKARYYRELSSWQRKQFGEEYAYFTEYKNSNKEIAKFRHDWNNHMMVMQSMLQSGEYDKVREYFEDLSKTAVAVKKKVITGNDTVDTIFAVKEPLFVEYGIRVECDGNLSRFCSIEPVDASILFSNLIDNAIESCSQCEGERYLHLLITESPHNWMIVLENSRTGDISQTIDLKKGEMPQTTKKDKAQHGFGLENIMDIVKKYQGEMELGKETGTFVVKMLFPKEVSGL